MATISLNRTAVDSTSDANANLNNNWTTLENLLNGAIEAVNLAADAVTAAKIASGAVGTDELAALAVTNAKLAADAVTDAKVAAAAAIAVAKLAAGSARSVLKTDGTTPAWLQAPEGGLIYATATDIAATAAPTDGQGLRSVGTVPTWVTNPHARVRRAAAQSIPTGTWTAISFDALHKDSDAMWAVSPNPTRLTIKTAGNYLIGGSFSIGGAGTTGRVGAEIRKNGVAQERQIVPQASSSSARAVVSDLYGNLVVGDFFELFGLQDTGGSLNTLTALEEQPKFWAVRIA